MLAANIDDSGGAPFPYPGPTGGGADPTTPSPTPTATVPQTTPSAPPSQVQLSPGSTPDYSGLITSDPSYVAAQTAANAARGNADAQRRAAIRSAFIRYGGKMPDGWTDSYGDIDQATKDAAAGNQNSALSQLHDNYQRSVESFRRALAARGALQSGDLSYGQDQLDRGLSQQEYDAANSFGDQVNQAVTGYAGVLGSNAQNLAGAIGSAESNVYGNPANRPVAPSYADYDPTSSARWGKPVYKGADGTLYSDDGSVFNAPGTSNATTPTPMSPDGSSAPVAQLPYTPGPTDSNGVPTSAGFYGFDSNGNWIG